PFEEMREIVGAVVDEASRSAVLLPAFALHGLASREDEDRRHTEAMRHLEIARYVLEHGGPLGDDAEMLDEEAIGPLVGLGDEATGLDVEHAVEEMVDLEMRRRLHRVPMRSRGEDIAATGQLRDRLRQRLVGGQRRAVDVMREVEEDPGVEIVLDHQAA